jgi:hypothetical protein
LLLPDISTVQFGIIVALAVVSAIAGGVAGYGTGALMPLILVPIVGNAHRRAGVACESPIPRFDFSVVFEQTTRG